MKTKTCAEILASGLVLSVLMGVAWGCLLPLTATHPPSPASSPSPLLYFSAAAFLFGLGLLAVSRRWQSRGTLETPLNRKLVRLIMKDSA